jgi:AraC-like DNA-binding protein
MISTTADIGTDTAWGTIRARPTGRVGEAVVAYTGWREHAAAPVGRWERPRGGMSLIVSFGPLLRVTAASASASTTVRSFVVGMHDEPAFTEHDGMGHGVQIDLTTAGAYALVGGPIEELTNRVTPIDDVCRLDTDRLVDRLLSSPSHADRLRALDAELGDALSSGRQLSPEVAWADGQLRAAGGRIRIAALVGELGWSGRRMVERFRREVGVPPKTVARLARFNHAMTLLSGPARGGTLAHLAAECGYADQSHFNREFRAFAGCTPTEFLTEFLAEVDAG